MALDRDHLDKLAGITGQGQLPPLCPTCGYNLRGAVTNRCSECGMVFLQRELRQADAELRALLVQLKGIDGWSSAGLKFGIAGLVIVALGLTLRANSLGSIMGAICGLPALFLGLNALRIMKLPVVLRRQLGVEPKYVLSFASAGLGLLLLAWVVFGRV